MSDREDQKLRLDRAQMEQERAFDLGQKLKRGIIGDPVFVTPTELLLSSIADSVLVIAELLLEQATKEQEATE